MARTISICDAKKRDAQVEAIGAKKRERYRWVDEEGAEAILHRLIKGTERTSYEALLRRFEAEVGEAAPEALGAALIEGDPEIDLTVVGRKLGRASRVYLSANGDVLFSARMLRVTYDATGAEVAREDFVDVEATVGEEQPALPWTGRLMPIDSVVRRFAFVRSLQLRHVNGLTFDFLFDIAKHLHEQQKLLYVGAGKKGELPLIFQTNGAPYRGFLEGRVQDEAYLLILHLSNLELKRPPQETGS